jgi:hypothetical protein
MQMKTLWQVSGDGEGLFCEALQLEIRPSQTDGMFYDLFFVGMTDGLGNPKCNKSVGNYIPHIIQEIQDKIIRAMED